MLTLDGYPSALRPTDRLIAVDGMPIGLPAWGAEHGLEVGLLVEMASYEPAEGYVVTVWGKTQMFELRLAANTPIRFGRGTVEAPPWEQAMADVRARLHKIAVEEAGDPSDTETCDQCGVHRGHENDCPNNPYNLDDEADPIDLADAAAGRMTPGSEY